MKETGRTIISETPKKAGDTITCLRCHGRGYVRQGLTNDYPVECDRCQGTGKQTVRPRP